MILLGHENKARYDAEIDSLLAEGIDLNTAQGRLGHYRGLVLISSVTGVSIRPTSNLHPKPFRRGSGRGKTDAGFGDAWAVARRNVGTHGWVECWKDGDTFEEVVETLIDDAKATLW